MVLKTNPLDNEEGGYVHTEEFYSWTESQSEKPKHTICSPSIPDTFYLGMYMAG